MTYMPTPRTRRAPRRWAWTNRPVRERLDNPVQRWFRNRSKENRLQVRVIGLGHCTRLLFAPPFDNGQGAGLANGVEETPPPMGGLFLLAFRRRTQRRPGRVDLGPIEAGLGSFHRRCR